MTTDLAQPNQSFSTKSYFYNSLGNSFVVPQLIPTMMVQILIHSPPLPAAPPPDNKFTTTTTSLLCLSAGSSTRTQPHRWFVGLVADFISSSTAPQLNSATTLPSGPTLLSALHSLTQLTGTVLCRLPPQHVNNKSQIWTIGQQQWHQQLPINDDDYDHQRQQAKQKATEFSI